MGETDVTFDVFGELDGIACVAGDVDRSNTDDRYRPLKVSSRRKLRGYVDRLAWFA